MSQDTIRKPSVEKPWMQFFSEEAKKATIPQDTIYNVVKNNNADNLDNYALNYFGNRIKYGEMLNRIEIAAAAFEKLGIKSGDMVMCCSITIPEATFVLYALNKLGATLYMVDPRIPAAEVKDMYVDAKAKIFIILDYVYEFYKSVVEDPAVKTAIVLSVDTSLPFALRTLKQIKAPAPKIPYGNKIYSWDGFMSLGKSKKSRTAKYGENDVAAITMTGGTTGKPKGVMLTNLAFNAVMEDFNNCGVPYTRKQRFMDIIPMFASYGIVASLHMPLGLGIELVVIPKFNPDEVGHYVKKYKPTHTLMVPAHYEKLMNSKEVKRGLDLSFFETAGSGGDTMNVGLETKLNNFLKSRGCRFPLSQGYGMSEVGSAASCYCNGNFRSQSVGYPLLFTTISIFEPGTTNELTYNQEGEICITGPALMKGYFNNPEETAKVLITHPDGTVWVHSGDIGYMDEDGYLFIKGRIKRMITLFSGHKVFPTYIEDAIGKYKGQESCAVVGVVDTIHAQGQRVLAVVKLNEGVTKEQATKDLQEIFMKDIDFSSRPFDIVFVDEMPRTGMGKIDYAKLSKDYEAAHAGATV